MGIRAREVYSGATLSSTQLEVEIALWPDDQSSRELLYLQLSFSVAIILTRQLDRQLVRQTDR